MSKLFITSEVESEFPDLLKELKNDLIWLKAACKSHSSVDTFAKKLFISNDNQSYNRLKNILAVYLTIEQKFHAPDLRYDNFWASILDGKYLFPAELRVLSWNYDFQLELSYMNFANCKSLEDSCEILQIASKETAHEFQEPNKFSIFKINGSAKISLASERSEHYFSDKLLDTDNRIFFNMLFKRMLQLKSGDGTNQLRFAWEHSQGSGFIEALKASVCNTTILVVVGYSFPLFNRKVDRMILKQYMQSLKKVYFQAPDAENLKERFLAIRDDLSDDALIIRKDKDQFVFPNEF